MPAPANVRVTPDGFELIWPERRRGRATLIAAGVSAAIGLLLADLKTALLLFAFVELVSLVGALIAPEPCALLRAGDRLVCQRRAWRWRRDLSFSLDDLTSVTLEPEGADAGPQLLLQLRQGELLVLRGLDEPTLAWVHTQLDQPRLSSSTSKTSVAPGGMTPPAPRAP